MDASMKFNNFLVRAENTGYMPIQSDVKTHGYVIDPEDRTKIMLLNGTGALNLRTKDIDKIVRELLEVKRIYLF